MRYLSSMTMVLLVCAAMLTGCKEERRLPYSPFRAEVGHVR